MAFALLSGILSMARADNLTLSPLSLTPGQKSELVFKLENNTSYYGFQADITLPDGVTPVMNSNGKPTVALGSRFGTSYMAYSSVISTGEVRIGTFSANHTAITGNSGELFRVPVNISSDFKGGVVKVTGIKFIDAVDKDVNFPGIILSTTVDIPTFQDTLYIENFDIMQGNTKSVAIMLDNNTTYTAFQADITLSSNLTLVPGSFALTDRASGLTLSEKVTDGVIRIAAFSANKSSISGSSGTLLTFSVKAADTLGQGSISLSNILFTSSDIQEYRFGNTVAQVSIVEPYATDILLSKENIVMLVGDAADITATVLPENAKDKTVVWTSQNATVAKYENGKIVALSASTTTVTATCGEATATCTVTVKSGSDITVRPGSGTGDGEDDGNGWITGNDVYVHVNRTVNMNLSMPEGLTEAPTLTWKLSNGGEKFVKLIPAGNTLSAAFTGLSVGETGYTVSLNGKDLLTGKVTVIAEITMNSLHLEPSSLSMAQNALPVKLETIYTPTNASMPEFNWTSSNPAVATIGDDGTVTPKTQGRTTITATALDGSGLSATAEITVTAPIAESFEFEEAAMGGVEGISIFIGDTYTLQPKAKEGYVLPDNIVWSSDRENIASVDQKGKVTGLAMGEAIVTASAIVNGKEVKATCKVTVKPIPLTSVLVTAQSTTTLMDGETVQLTAKTEPADATQPIDVVWSSDKPEVASVDEKTGLVTAHSVIGKATITAVASNPADIEVKGTIEITVIATGASRIILNTYDLTMLVGQENHLTGTVEPATTTNPIINWSIDNPLIASIDNDGNITAISAGMATVTATCGEATATCTVTVKGTEDVTVKPGDGTTPGDDDDTPGNNTENGGSLIGSDLTLRVNQSAAIELEIPEGLSVEPKFEWNLNAGGAELVNMTVNANTLSATFKGLKVGETGYTVYIIVANGNIEAAKGKIKVIAEVPMAALSIEPSEVTMEINESPMQLKTVVSPENSTLKDFSWTSSNPEVATVDQKGSVTPQAIGETTITVKALDGSELSATCKVTVIEVQAKSITIEGDDITTLKETETLQLTAIVLPEDTAYPEVTWETSAPDIASVSDNGLVTAIAEGEVTITAFVTNQPTVRADYTLTVQKRLLGDANDNGVVNVADVVTISDYIVHKEVFNFCFVNADVTGDKEISPADVTATVDIIMNETPAMARSKAMNRDKIEVNDCLIVDDFRLNSIDTEIGVNLQNNVGYSALYALFRIPQGMEVKNVSLGERCADHSLNYNFSTEGLEVMIYSLSNRQINAGDGNILKLIVNGKENVEDITVENICAADIHSNEYALQFAEGHNESQSTALGELKNSQPKVVTTEVGIEILNAQDATIKVFATGGEMLVSKTGVSSIESIPLVKGIYIVTVNGISSKVIVK